MSHALAVVHHRGVVVAALIATVALVLGVVLLPPLVVGVLALAASVIVIFRRALLNWTTVLFLLAGIIMFIPVRRYTLPIDAPVQLEPYRVVVVLLVAALATALVTRPGMARARVPFGVPISVFVGSLLVTFLINLVPLTRSQPVEVSLGHLTQTFLLLSIALVVRQLLTSERLVMALLTFLVWAAVVVAFFAIVERFTRVNVFLLFGNVLPLVLLRDDSESIRAGGARAYGSSQHPIALAVLLCMMIPIAIYLARYAAWPRHEVSRKLLYAAGVAVIVTGMLTTVSRTGVVVLAVMFAVVLVFRPILALTLALVAVPLAVLAAAVLPGLFDSVVGSFFDVDALLESQYASPGFSGQGRLADLDPAFAIIAQRPFFGTGPGSWIVVGENQTGFILDNQALSALMEGGVVGLIGLLTLIFAPPIILLARVLRHRGDPRHALLGFALALSMLGYGAALFLHDSFAFLQTFMVFAILLAVGGWLIDERLTTRPPHADGRSALPLVSLARD